MYKDLANYDLDLNAKTPDWRTRVIRVLVKDALIFITVLVLAEIMLRVFAPGTQSLIYTEGVTGGHPVVYNDFGLRDTAFPLEKPANEKRILALGNSTTFGSGVAMEETWPKQLQTLFGEPWFVINGGGQGSSLPQIKAFMQEYGYAMQPDHIILGFSPAIIAKTKITSKPASLTWKQKLRVQALKIHKIMHSSYAYSAFNHYVRKSLYRTGVLEDDLTQLKGALYAYGFNAPGVDIERVEQDYIEFFEQLDEFRNELARRNIEFAAAGIPSRFELSEKSSDNPRNFPIDKIRIRPLERMEKYAQKNDIPYVDLSSALKNEDNVFINGDYSHLNKQGNALAAKEIFKSFKE